MKKLVSILTIVLWLFSSCKQRVVDFTIISTKNIDISKGATFQKGKTRIAGNDKIHIIIIVPTGTPHIKTAVDKAIEKIPGCVAILDGVVYSKVWYVPYIYGQSEFIVEGTPLIDPSLVLNNGVQLPDYTRYKFDSKGNVINESKISEEKYLALKSKLSKQDALCK